ncbi:hypothetical protein V8G54_033267, partial [Vigna mungo]
MNGRDGLTKTCHGTTYDTFTDINTSEETSHGCQQSDVFHFTSKNPDPSKSPTFTFDITSKGWSHMVLPSQDETLDISLLDLLYFMWLFTNCPAAIADISDSSPARTDPATMVAKTLEFDP